MTAKEDDGGGITVEKECVRGNEGRCIKKRPDMELWLILAGAHDSDYCH